MLLAHYVDIFRKNVCHKEVIFGFHFSSKGVLTYLLERGDPGPVTRTTGPRSTPDSTLPDSRAGPRRHTQRAAPALCHL